MLTELAGTVAVSLATLETLFRLSHLFVMDPVLRVVPDPEPDDETPVGEHQ